MIKKINNDTRGQTALILILLTAAALIFLAISLNWGRIAQTKALLTVAADQSASLLASEVASYGEMQKQTYLSNANQLSGQTGILVDILMIVVAIVALVVTYFFPPAGWGIYTFCAALLLEAAAVVLAVVNLALQLAVVQPGITSLWNALQKSQPIQQQFYEGGIVTALEGSVTDQVNITDYFDSNANGIFGSTNNAPNDTVGRFALFYTDRLKMLNKPVIPQVVFFYDQLGELMNGETCDQNESDYASYPLAVGLNSACISLNSSPTYCINNPTDPACQMKIPNVFQLNDACSSSDPTNTATYSPYCDPCCQLLQVLDPLYSATNPNPLHPTQYKSVRPSPPTCTTDISANGAPVQCLTNNPYGAPYTLLYDPTFQNYAAGVSFLAQYGRDQPRSTPSGTLPDTLPFTLQPDVIGVTPVVEFPNGVFPFFWLMEAYSPEVDTIDPTSSPPVANSPDLHWCAPATAAVNGVNIPAFTVPTGFPDLVQLSLSYSCQGKDCCVNYLADNVGSIGGVPTPISDGTPNGTVNGAIDIVGSPNPALNSSFGENGSGFWLPGDNQMCSTTWPYNGANLDFPDGTCEWTDSTTAPPPPSLPLVEPPSTLDALDDTMHALSDFVNFSNTFLSNDVDTLSSTFTTWYPQVDAWINSSTGRLPPLVANLSSWNTVITIWLNSNYESTNAWCVPPEATLLGENGSIEDAYINSNDSGGPWGSLPSVIACLNYNAGTTPANNYQQCLAKLNAEASTCSALPAQCAPLVLGRSLAGPAPVFTPGALSSCDPTATAPSSFANWVQNSYTLATDEAPKFALRSAFLKDVYNRGQTMSILFQAGYKALSAFLAPCSGTNCSAGGPAAQLTYAYSQPSPVTKLPNSVIYGWVDNTYSNGQPGYAHIVKVTAYSAGRNGTNVLTGLPLPVRSVLPWIQTTTSGFLDLSRTYTLTDRDGLVYVSVKRWDEDHSNSILFPNGHPLWQFLFHNPNGGGMTTGHGLINACSGLTGVGLGLDHQTVKGLGYAGILPQDQAALANAFMLNDNVNGTVDPDSNTGAYASCLSAANGLLVNAPESHICVEYIASRNASVVPSDPGATDYSLKFVSCQQQPEDLT